MTIGEKIKDIRIKNNISQKEFAKMLGISQQSITLYENDKRNPSPSILQKIKIRFDLRYDYFVPDIDNSNDISKEKFYKCTIDFLQKMSNIDFSGQDIENIENDLIEILTDYMLDLNFFLYENGFENMSVDFYNKDTHIFNKYISHFNEIGRQEVFKRMEELTHLKKYTERD